MIATKPLPKCSCYGGFDCEICNPDYYEEQEMTTTDTPLTDAETWDVVYHHKNEIVVDADFARQLERELTEAKALCDAQYKAIQRLEQEEKPEYWREKGLLYCEQLKNAEAEIKRLWRIVGRQHDLLCEHGLAEYGN